MGQKIELRYGAMADHLAKQIKQQKFKFDKEKVDRFDKEKDAINLLRFGNCLLTESMADKLMNKLHNKVLAHIAKANGQQVVK